MSGTELIYVIEDDPVAVFVAELLLRRERLGGEVQFYGNGETALTRLQAAQQDAAALPALILLDLNMPLMDGWDFLEAFANLALARQVAVLVLTSSIRDADRERVRRYPQVKGYLAKPLDEAKIQQIKQLLAAG